MTSPTPLDPAPQELLAAVAERLVETIGGALERFPWAAEHPRQLSALAGGKHVRAEAFLSVALAYGAAERSALIETAAAIELLHTASLVHDDIIDGSELRRGEPALYRATDPGTAILVGDLLIALALDASAARPEGVGAELAAAFRGLCEGQLIEPTLTWAADGLPRIEHYGSLKTGALFGAAYALGGRAAGLPATEQDALRAAGIRLGLAFQLRDDLLDIHADAEELGKDAAADLRNGVPTFPLWHAARAARSGAEEAIDRDRLAAAAAAPEIAGIARTRIAELSAEAAALIPAAPAPVFLARARAAILPETDGAPAA